MMKKHPALWFLVGWLFALLFSPKIVIGLFSGGTSPVSRVAAA